MNMKIPEYLLQDDDEIDEAPDAVDFSEYMWMVDGLEEFDRAVEEEFWEEAFMEACFEEMLAEEEAQWMYYNCEQHTNSKTCSSKLNPNAPEFVPRISNMKFT